MRSKISMSTSKPSLDGSFENFIRKCEIKNLTDKSIKSYREKIIPFQHFSVEKKLTIDDINSDVVDDYILWMRKNLNANDISINSYLRTLRAFLYFDMDNGYIQRFKISIPKADKKIKETYTDAELKVLLKKPEVNDCSFTEFKVWAFENFLLGTGVRLSTALEIKIKDIDFTNGYIFLGKLKNRKQQYIPLARSLGEVLKEYLKYRGGDPEDCLFCNNYGEPASERTYQQLVQKYNNDRGIMRTSCHAFRHTFAKMFILNGGDPFRLQKIMGHSDISVTKEYVDMFGQDLAIGFDRFNPLDNMSCNGNLIRMH